MTDVMPERLGLPSVKAARAALSAHLAIQKGEGIRGAVADALAGAKGLGGKERRFLVVAVRGLSRHLRRVDAAARSLGHPPGTLGLEEDRALLRWVLWRRLFTGADWKAVGPEVRLPGPVRPRTVPDALLEKVMTAPLPPERDEGQGDGAERAAAVHSFPNWLARAVARDVGEARVERVLAALNVEPEVFLRVRPAASGEDAVEAAMLALREEGVETLRVDWAPSALRVVSGGMKVFDTRPMRAGRLQVQEPGSQLIALACAVEGEPVRAVDYCAGAGGKTLALADLWGRGGVIEAHDRSARRLAEARRRVKAWSLGQVRFSLEIDRAVAKADVVLVDAPCSGTGGLAREPEQKWRLTQEKVRAFAATQREILDGLAPAMKAGARLVYATCSVLREEDEDVVAGFLETHTEWEVEPLAGVLPPACAKVLDEEGRFLRVWPDAASAGGFFAARLRRRSSG